MQKISIIIISRIYISLNITLKRLSKYKEY